MSNQPLAPSCATPLRTTTTADSVLSRRYHELIVQHLQHVACSLLALASLTIANVYLKSPPCVWLVWLDVTQTLWGLSLFLVSLLFTLAEDRETAFCCLISYSPISYFDWTIYNYLSCYLVSSRRLRSGLPSHSSAHSLQIALLCAFIIGSLLTERCHLAAHATHPNPNARCCRISIRARTSAQQHKVCEDR
ncbi:hypothetical protein BCR37DRAFT_168396 [Protomyces lactucae-debilis]|uniref:Uncharacterized protein n=1 Tax=Protomyces lactucae-debilis TaxID=2754530 RepID=A0A1Y2EWZ3_PROLT|nr:uncharacterized protein BCR37DRAFT_168396 [Protomyces lactucae-debilis]ORY76080.1 hypothetical protein BCR37DRAFT_168396 [Protomyces lactucae-debilis]